MARNDSEKSKTDRELLEEIAQRSRRTETRVTVVANHIGADVGTKPELRGSRLCVPSPKITLADIVAALDGHTGLFSVYCGDDYLAQVAL